MLSPKFNMNELTVAGEVPSIAGGPGTPIYTYPVTPKEACKDLYAKNPLWQMVVGFGVESMLFTPSCNPDNIARACVFDSTFVPGVSNQVGGKDMFGVDWEFVPIAQGSMVKPGKPLFSDANEWYDKVVWPDIERWDWEGARTTNEAYLSTSNFYTTMFFNGWYERLISFMDFENAIVALIDDDQKDAVKDLLDKLTDLYIRILDKYVTYFPQIDSFCIHDDWGSQKNAFFSPETCAEMIVPYMKRVTDFLHSKGKICDLHSCGNNISQVPNMVAAGWDSWTPQAMNDTRRIYQVYGDRILIAVMPDLYDTKTTSENEQRAFARAYADEFCKPEKPSSLNMYAAFDTDILTNAYREELYKQSRINYVG